MTQIISFEKNENFFVKTYSSLLKLYFGQIKKAFKHPSLVTIAFVLTSRKVKARFD